MDHWHPVLSVGGLRDKPVRVQLAGRSIALFRADGKIGALEDCCVHRRMSLSCGWVDQGRLHCTYHGWSYDLDGNGESPSTPKMHAKTSAYKTRVEHGAIWLRNADGSGEFPFFDIDKHAFVGLLRHQIPAPLEIVLDNFTEVEHTPTTHALLGYEITRMQEVQTQVEATDRSVRVYNAGPQKRLSRWIEWLFGVRSGDTFVDDWTTYFSPVYTVYNQYWMQAADQSERGVRWRIYVFFNPIDDQTTELMTFAFIKESSFPLPLSFLPPMRPVLMSLVDREIRLDAAMLARLADKRPDIEGMKLSRFDRVLGLNRDRIDHLYRGNGNGHAACAAVVEPASESP